MTTAIFFRGVGFNQQLGRAGVYLGGLQQHVAQPGGGTGKQVDMGPGGHSEKVRDGSNMSSTDSSTILEIGENG